MITLKKHARLVGLVIGISLFLVGLVFMVLRSDDMTSSERGYEVPARFVSSNLDVDFSKSSVELDQILSGGPGKDGIPALTNPEFVDQSDARIQNEVQVIYIENNGEEKLYPYNILTWHEIVNDAIGGEPVIVTFCPLCGSAIVFESTIDDQVVEFGVSGYLYESNMIMYSREDSESLWSQSLGRAVVGDRLGQELEHYPFQLMSYGDAKSRYADARVLSTDTGHSRNYDNNPYAGYEDSEELIFPVSVDDFFPSYVELEPDQTHHRTTQQLDHRLGPELLNLFLFLRLGLD
jgi:hypothetical protein